MLLQAYGKYFAVPLWANIKEGLALLADSADRRYLSKTVQSVLTRAKKNVVAYCKPPARKKHKRGRPREYGKKLKLSKLFDSKAKCYTFQTIEANIYGQSEDVRYLVLNLLWKPVKGMLRFVLGQTSHGRIVLVSSDLNLNPVTAIQLYCRRVTIETMFDTLKNTLGAMAYHFWSQYLSPASRRPKKKKNQKQNSLNPTHHQNL